MPKIERTGEVNGKSATDLYEASVTAFERAGFEVWKKRPMGWLSLARKKVDGVAVDGNLSARPTMPPSYTLVLSAEGTSSEVLSELADQVLSAFRTELEG
jgi:hypothetical protein